jgi:hypothetical protein
MHTPVEFYLKLPVDLFRGGSPKRHRFDYLRTLPPRTDGQVYDVKINPRTGLIDHTSGGLSLFAVPDFSLGPDWWIVPAGTELPKEFVLTKDLTNGRFRGHYTIRAQFDIDQELWRRKLLDWADTYAIHIDKLRKASGNV